MTASTDRLLVDFLREGPETGPREGLERALAATHRVGQRPGWATIERWSLMDIVMTRTPNSRPVLLLATVGLLMVLLATAVLWAGAQPPPVPEPFGLAKNGVVAYVAEGDLLVADRLGMTPRVLVPGPIVEGSSAFSRQGDRLAYVREGTGGQDLIVARSDGSDPRVLMAGFQGFGGASWSPDGTRILLGFTDFGMRKLAIVMADGSGSRVLEGTGPAEFASWRPDGGQMTFRSHGGDLTQASGVYLADADGTNIRRLDLIDPTASLGDYGAIRWSPDGTRFTYMALSPGSDDIDWQIHVVDVDADGGVVDHPMRFVPGSTREVLPAWAPDGRRIAINVDHDGQRQIAITEPVDGAPVTLVGPAIPSALGGLGHSWSPDGRTLLVAVWPRVGEPSSWSVDVETGAATALEGPVIDLPAWQRLAP
jgi:Tol biopolymer transport system component